MQVEPIQLVASSGRANLISRSVNRIEIAGRVLSFLLMKTKHLWTLRLGTVALVTISKKLSVPNLQKRRGASVAAQEEGGHGEGPSRRCAGRAPSALQRFSKGWGCAAGGSGRGLRISLGFQNLGPDQDLATASPNLAGCMHVRCLLMYPTK